MTTTTKKTAERLIKKYPNRRLYDTETSTYITLTDVKQLVLDQEDFKVIDAKSNEDLTRAILLQIILEEESGGLPMFSSSMLSQIIRFYGHAMQGMMGTYLEKNIQAFIDIQAKLADQSKNLYEGKAMNPEVWSQFMNMQAPMMQGMMTSYIEQSKNMFVQMQEQMQNQAKSMFATFPFTPGGPVNAGNAPGRRKRIRSRRRSNAPSDGRGICDVGAGGVAVIVVAPVKPRTGSDCAGLRRSGRRPSRQVCGSACQPDMPAAPGTASPRHPPRARRRRRGTIATFARERFAHGRTLMALESPASLPQRSPLPPSLVIAPRRTRSMPQIISLTAPTPSTLKAAWVSLA